MEQFNDLKAFVVYEMTNLLKYDVMSEELLLKILVTLIFSMSNAATASNASVPSGTFSLLYTHRSLLTH